MFYTLPECSADADCSGEVTSAHHKPDVTIPMYDIHSPSDIWVTLTYNEEIKYTFQDSKKKRVSKWLPAWCGYLLLLAMLVASLICITASLSLATNMAQEVVTHVWIMFFVSFFILICFVEPLKVMIVATYWTLVNKGIYPHFTKKKKKLISRV